MQFTTKNGVEAEINLASFKAATELKNAIADGLVSAGIPLDLKGFSADTEIDINKVIEAVLKVDTSPRVYKALFECLAKSKYDSEKITEATFEPEQAREDYYEIVIACVKVNITPFLKGLTSRLSGLKSQIVSSIQK